MEKSSFAREPADDLRAVANSRAMNTGADGAAQLPYAILGVAWALVVLVAYAVINWGYFVEKFSVFGRFLLGGA